MAWLTSFLLGRPGAELSFSVNPAGIEIKPAQICVKKRTLSGRLRKWVFRTSYPTITLDSSFFTVSDYNAMSSLLAVTDTMLSFKVRDSGFQNTLEICYPTSTSIVPIRENSAVLLSAALIAASAASSITITGVFDNAAGTGTNHYTGGSYADASYAITLGTPLANTNACYVTYTYTGWLVEMSEIGAQFVGGQVDLGKISGWQLQGC